MLVLNHSPMSRGFTDAVYRYAFDREKGEALAAWELGLGPLTLARGCRRVGKLAPAKPPKKKPLLIVDKLFAAGVPVSALWIFDRMFQAAFARPDDTSPLMA